MESVQANLVDIIAREIRWSEVLYEQGRITRINKLGEQQPGKPYLIPGFVDAHVHIESSMLVPDEFAFAALEQGTLASVSDPHEIANVLGVRGIDFMRERAALTPFPILFGAPSCVPATPFESAGAKLTQADIQQLLSSGRAGYLSEVMNFPGVLNRQPDVMEKIAAARHAGVPIDGHAPGLQGGAARQYASAGITTDHECTTLDEAFDKISAGMRILIREGSAAQDFAALHPLLGTHPDQVMFCSDDKHPDDLLVNHVRSQVIRAIELGYPLFDVLRAASFNAVRHYRLPLGLLQTGDRMDALLVQDLQQFTLDKAWLAGKEVVSAGRCTLPHHPVTPVNHFAARNVDAASLSLTHPNAPCRIIVARDGQLLTQKRIADVPNVNGKIAADIQQDVLLLAVVNRYEPAPPALGLIHGFRLREGAMASSVAHDSHNIVAVGTSPQWLALAINEVIRHQGGLCAVDGTGTLSLPLPVAGLMSDQPAAVVGPRYHSLNEKAGQMGSHLRAPFMTLSFMALLVIPELKLSDKGLFDGKRFAFCSLAADASETARPELWLQPGVPA